MNPRNAKEDLIPRKPPLNDAASLWSHYAKKKPRYNRMDPDPDPESDPDDIYHYHRALGKVIRNTNKTAKEEKSGGEEDERISDEEIDSTRVLNNQTDAKGTFLSKSDWRKFWVQRVRQQVNVPNLTDKEIADMVDLSKRVYVTRWQKNGRPHIDPDLPSCYYWDEFQVAEWAESLNLPDDIPIQEMLLNNNISGRRLVTLHATTLVEMGIHELELIKKITKRVREILGLPAPNALRAMSRLAPLERYLWVKARTGVEVDRLTFKEFCEKEAIDYEAAKIQKKEGYRRMPAPCQVIIEPTKGEKIDWYQPTRSLSGSDNSLLNYSEESSSNGYLPKVPTVEDLVNNAALRNLVISNILNEIVEKVYETVSKTKEEREQAELRQKIADEIFNNYMAQVYSDFSLFDPEDRLKLITVIAEELVNDVLRAREVLEDIDGFTERIKSEIPEKDLTHLQDAVGLYVKSIMPLVVSSALKQLEESSQTVKQSSEAKRETTLASRSGWTPNGYNASSENEDGELTYLYKTGKRKKETTSHK